MKRADRPEQRVRYVALRGTARSVMIAAGKLKRQSIMGAHIASTAQIFPPSVALGAVVYDNDPTKVVIIDDVSNSAEVFHEDGSTEVHSLDGIFGEDESPLQELRSEERYLVRFTRALFRRLHGRARIHQPFGHNVYVMLEFLCSDTTMKTIVNQTIADIREEVSSALETGRTAKAQWIHVRGQWTLFKALGLNAIVKLIARVVTGWRSAS